MFCVIENTSTAEDIIALLTGFGFISFIIIALIVIQAIALFFMPFAVFKIKNEIKKLNKNFDEHFKNK